MIELRNRFLKLVLLLGLLVVLAFLWVQPINLAAVDIGRHIKNGELILAGHTDLLYKNYYSFTHPDYPFINHHWFFGVISFLLWKATGFNGLSIFYVGILLTAFLLFAEAARRQVGFIGVFFLAALTLTVITDRREIRPEGVSALLMAVYIFFMPFPASVITTADRLNVFIGNPDKGKRILGGSILLLAQLIWVNTHIFFFLGPLLVALCWWEARLVNASSLQQHSLAKLLAALVAINILNPSGLWGMLTPLNIFKEFGYRLAENQNIFFMMKRFNHEPAYYWFLGLVVLVLMGIVVAVRRDGIKPHVPFIVLAVFVAAAGVKAVRLMPFLGFFFLPLAARFFKPWLRPAHLAGKAVLLMAAIILIAIQAPQAREHLGIGLAPKINGSAEFFKAQALQGPIFSNYDIGGFLIYHLAPQEKVFVDNRQEAFPPEFFKDVYVPMQEKPELFKQVSARYQFNVIYFYRHDLTPWGQQFMVDRISDLQWAPVFVDDYTIIFARRGSVNQAVIDRFELPNSMFGISHPQ